MDSEGEEDLLRIRDNQYLLKIGNMNTYYNTYTHESKKCQQIVGIFPLGRGHNFYEMKCLTF